jgi:uncharacterized peroxidase-related enzyme
VRHHGAALRRLLKDKEKVTAIASDYRGAALSPRERAICDYAVKLTRTPGEMAERDVQALREAGLADADILDTCQIAAYYNYVNRMADGLGVELEDYWTRRMP